MHVAVGHSVYLGAGIEAGGSASQQQAPTAALVAEMQTTPTIYGAALFPKSRGHYERTRPWVYFYSSFLRRWSRAARKPSNKDKQNRTLK